MPDAALLLETIKAVNAAPPATPMLASEVAAVVATLPIADSDVLTFLIVLSKWLALPLISTVNPIIVLLLCWLCQFAL